VGKAGFEIDPLLLIGSPFVPTAFGIGIALLSSYYLPGWCSLKLVKNLTLSNQNQRFRPTKETQNGSDHKN
jgi:hypothetical protein